MKKTFLLIGAIISLASAAFAQKENNVWAFGDRMGIDFNTGSPVIIQTAIRTTGGSASVCDTSGQLLFYTQGDTLWNKNNTIMPNGSGLISPYTSNAGNQSSQGQLILPVINNQNRYYVFSIEGTYDYLFNGDPYASRLFYSVVDMTLDGGLGDVVPALKEIPIDSVLTGEKMIAIPGDSCSLWLLVHRVDDATFKAYKINDTGISVNPVISVCGTMSGPESYALGKMKLSPDGTKLVTSDFLFGTYGCELYDFNAATGVVSNPVAIDSIPEGISACFSPDNSKLYYFSFAGGNGNLYQYDLSQPSTAAIVNSRTLIDSLTDAGAEVYDAKIGPDGKIYTKMPYSIASGTEYDTIGRIDFPNIAGTACSYTRAGLTSTQPILLGNGDLPNVFVKPRRDTSFVNSNANLTLAGTLTLQAPAGYASYQWNTGDTTDTITVTHTGTFWVVAADYCSQNTDTFHVDPPLGISNVNQQANSLDIYPNPATNDVTVDAGNIKGAGSIKVIDVLGKTVITAIAQGSITHINVAPLAAGIYQVVYTSDKDMAGRLHASLVISK